MDVLDHSCSKLGFGGKMCLDGTAKTEEEMNQPPQPFALSPDFNETLLIAKLPQIQAINSRLAKEWQLPVLFVAVEKEKPDQVKETHLALCQLPGLAGIKMVLYVEPNVDVQDIADVLWRHCNNLDPRRDHTYDESGKILGLDGTRKTKALDGFERPWPNVIAADAATIAAVDEKWNQLGLGGFIKSPSLKYRYQTYLGEAAVLDNESET